MFGNRVSRPKTTLPAARSISDVRSFRSSAVVMGPGGTDKLPFGGCAGPRGRKPGKRYGKSTGRPAFIIYSLGTDAVQTGHVRRNIVRFGRTVDKWYNVIIYLQLLLSSARIGRSSGGSKSTERI